MKKNEKQYIKSLQKWLDNAELNLNQMCFNNEFNRQEIEFHKQHLKLGEQQLKIELQRFEEVKQQIQQLKNN